MSFYEFIFITIFIYASNKGQVKSLKTNAGIDRLSPCSVGIIFYVRLNNTSTEDCYVEVTPDVCCLRDDGDCDILKIAGGCACCIPQGTSKLLKFVAPILDPYERQGYCTLFVDSKSKNQINKRETIKIDFDTSVHNYQEEAKIKRCNNVDEDPLNDCQPVDCDQYYNGKKPFYNKKLKRCVNVPLCIITADTYSDVIYNPISNRCIKKSIVKRDINALKKISNYNGGKRAAKDIFIITNDSNSEPGLSTFNLLDVNDPIVKYTSFKQVKKNNFNVLWNRLMLKNIPNYKLVIIFLGSIILIQCIFIGMIFCSKSKRTSAGTIPIVRNFFNNAQEESITTPLISSSNMDTGNKTVDNNFLTESSSQIPKPTKCYKSCDKETNENIKVSTSDDVLSKCLNRRDWKNHHKPAVAENETVTDITRVTQDSENQSNTNIFSTDNKDLQETKLVIENEKHKNEQKIDTVNVDKNRNHHSPTNETSVTVSPDINCYQTDNKLLTGKESCSTADKSKSAEKSAQIYFSKDSIDAILSERGYIYLAGGNLSKYSLSTDSNKAKSTDISNKASRNIARYFQSLLHRRSRHGPQSDPGKEQDVKLIHMSKASLYSSSNDSG